jgi:dienelactone hydrolase
VVIAASAGTARAWEGHDWEAWREVTTWQRPEIDNRNVGAKTLVPPLAGDGDSDRINEIRQWETRRAETARVIQRILGKPSPNSASAPSTQAASGVEAELLEEQVLDDHIRRHIRIRSRHDDWIPAILMIPRDRPIEPVPAMICIHQTVVQGKLEPCGIQGKPDLAFAQQIVRRGFVCIAPDMIGFGERIPPGSEPYHDSIRFYRQHPNWSYMGRMIEDVSRVVDYLETLPFVDRLQIGSIGHSHGAYTSLFSAAFEPRIALVIASCGFTPFRDDPRPSRWSHRTALIPQLGFYLSDFTQIPFDWQDICALIAPRPLFIWYGLQDAIFPNTDGVDAMLRDVRDVYGLYGAANDLAWHAFDGEHSFTERGRELAYAWMAERFFAMGNLKRIPNDLAEWRGQRERIRRAILRTIGPLHAMSTPPAVRQIETERLADYDRRLMEYNSWSGETIRAYVCIPHAAQRPLPAMLVLHQTSPEGKREAVGLADDRSLAFADDLARRGYVTLAPDAITAGERIDAFGAFDTRGHYLRRPDRSAMGTMLDEARLAMDVLVGEDGVDPHRIGVIGHSLGAETALMLAAFDQRVRATVASCGYATFEAEKDRIRWARDQWFSYMPRLRPVFLQGRRPHWDWPQVLELIAPRALYQHTTHDDQIFTESRSAYDAGETALAVWALYDQADNLVNDLEPGPHAIAEETKLRVYDWLDEQLRPASQQENNP